MIYYIIVLNVMKSHYSNFVVQRSREEESKSEIGQKWTNYVEYVFPLEEHESVEKHWKALILAQKPYFGTFYYKNNWTNTVLNEYEPDLFYVYVLTSKFEKKQNTDILN